jgi:pimeloyl-ACP methyl ester carboxylesterase
MYQRISLRATRWFTEHAGGLLSRVVNNRLGRVLLLGQTHGRPSRMTPAQARQAILAMGRCPGFASTYRATLKRHYISGPPIDAPLTVAFGSRDFLLMPKSRRLDQLPSHTRRVALPGCGHVPMYDDPETVTAVITASAARALPGGRPGSW